MALTTLVIVSLVVFSLIELVPGDCAERYLAFKNADGSSISVEDIEVEHQRLGLDRPLIERLGSWIIGAFQGDFGASCILRVDIAQLLGSTFWLSLAICLSSLTLAYAIAIPMGIISAASNNATLNNSPRIVSHPGLAMPNFLLALVIMLFSTIWFGETLTGLFSSEYRDAPWSWARFRDLLGHAWMPILLLGWSATASALQTLRALMSDEVGGRYLTAAAARGGCRGDGCCGSIRHGTHMDRSSTASVST